MVAQKMKTGSWLDETRHVGLASPEFQSQTILAARSEYDLIFYKNSSPKRVSENILSEKSFQIDKGQFKRFSSDFERL